MLQLRAYMASGLDSAEGAALVFHYSVKQAKTLVWRKCSFIKDVCGFDFTGLRVRRLNRPHLMEEALSSLPHVIESPATCPTCEMWGWPRVGEGCEGCAEEE